MTDDDLKAFILNELLEEGDITLTDEQETALGVFMDFYKSEDMRSTYLLTGSAGTGKTFLIRLFTKMLRRQGYKVVLLAPTGRAAKVVTRRTGRTAFTIHHHIYQVAEDFYGKPGFSLRPNKAATKVAYIVDEASMVGKGGEGSTRRGLLLDLLEFAFGEDPHRKLVLVGDPVQLPPVGSNSSPALDPDYLQRKGFASLYHAHLSEVKRQVIDSEVLDNAVRLRDAFLTQAETNPQIQLGREVQTLDNGWDGIENYLGYYREGDPDRVVFITYSNYRAVQVNMAIRQQIFFGDGGLLTASDLVMVVKNNYHWGDKKRLPFLANGEVGTVRFVDESTLEERYGLQYMDVEIEFVDNRQEPFLVSCKVVLNLLQEKTPQLSNDIRYKVQQARNAEYHGLPQKEANEAIQKDPYINALEIKYGHAVTGHKSQGGQWQNAIIGFEPDYGQDPVAYLRWTYTVFTRAEERVFLLDCPFVEM